MRLDNRVELFRVAYFLALEDSINTELRPCKTDFYTTDFEPYKKYSHHPLVQKIRTGDEWMADLPSLALCLGQDLKPKDNLNTDELIAQFGWYGKHIDSLSALLIDFKKTINFQPHSTIDFYPFTDSLKANQLPQKLQTFFRTQQKTKLNILFDPLNRITNKAITFTNHPNNERSLLLTYLCDQPNDSISPLKLCWNDDYRRIILHENCHLYTDRYFSKYYDNEIDSLVNQPKYKEKFHDIDEIIVRGITAKLLEINYGEKVGKEELMHQPKTSRLVYNYLDPYLAQPKMSFEKAYQGIIALLKKEFE